MVKIFISTLLLLTTIVGVGAQTPSWTQLKNIPVTLMKFRGGWANSTSYILNDVVTSGNATYVAIAPSIGANPGSSPGSWQLLSSNTGGGTVTFNGQAVAGGGSGNVNISAANHSVAINKGDGNAITGVTMGAHQTIIGVAGADPTIKTIPDCVDSSGNHLNYTQSTDSFSCGTTSSGGGGGSTSWNALAGCVPTVTSKVITLPTTCKVSTGPNSLAVAASASSTFDTTSATDGNINIDYDGGVFYIHTSTTGGICGAGFVCTPASPNYPNGVFKIASYTVSGGTLSGVSLDMSPSQNKQNFNGQDAARTWSSGAQTISFTPLHTPRIVSGTTDTLVNADCDNVVVYTSGSAVAVTIAQAGIGGNFPSGCEVGISVQGAGTVTLTPATSTVRNAASFAMVQSNFRYAITSDGTNYY